MNTVKYQGQSTKGPSYDLWHDCPVAEIQEDPSVGIHVFDDFAKWATPTAAATDAAGYSIYRDTGVNLVPTGLQGGGLLINGNDADNDEGPIQAAGGLVLSDTASVARKLWFEARIKKASVGDNGLAFFLGLLTQSSAAADILVDNTGAMAASKSYIGFRNLQDNGEELDFIYGDSGDTVVEWGADIATLVADTWVKLGIKYDPENTKRIRLWIDGVEYLTDYIDADDIADATTNTFPDGDVLGPAFLTKVGTAAEVLTNLGWWRWAQLAA